MAAFPTLRTGAVMQYPGSRTVQFSNQTVRFLDSSEQRYRLAASPLHRWEIKLDQLDPTEIGIIQAFFAAQQGAFVSFAFTDPWDGTVYPNCCMDGAIASDWRDDLRAQTALAVQELRS